ncbi:TusE/DsrC/DsvC family sulfur relay protein [Litoribrevibacter albus]|uniref:Sulfurtransferase n=1 Tax=Litoribrevibacter albus TaxID=1473156 RepID=A0AA37W7R3_9GAMM|nr:TusE/DsrC/DsvC family sulfur relay protein [Litoribrevibacter albus]GLQ31693.1 sulfurtransferase TusE [Litoribrevibacter albus]
MLVVNQQTIQTDKEGYLENIEDWNEDVAEALATSEQIELTDKHWEIIHVLREFYKTYETSPSARPLAKAVKASLGEEKANSIYLMTLFPESPAKQGAKIAGLPRPANCF